jgi:NADPH:quinone reductase-like Zn-dependent oxidoreductase
VTDMRAVRIHAYGGSDQLRVETAPKPEPGPGDVLVAVHAAGVNPVDWKIREGYLGEDPDRLPLILGWDVSGVVEAVGEDVTDVAVGDEVYSRPEITRPGAYAEYVVIAADEVAPKPRTLTHVEAAGVPLAGLTAWQALFDHAGLKADERVLVHAGAGGVGHLAIQVAKEAGAYVIATGSGSSQDLVKRLGADEFVDYREQRFEDAVDTVDVVFDTIGGETTSRSFDVLGEGGRLVSIAGQPDADEAERRGIATSAFMVQPNAAQLTELADLLDAGQVDVVIERSFPLDQVAAAHDLSAEGHVHGKLVLEVR